jgi:hypothetical protein
MKNVFSLVTFTAGAFCIAVFLTTLQSEEGLLQSGLNPSTTAVLRASEHVNDCRLRGPLLADIRGGLDVLSRLRDV